MNTEHASIQAHLDIENMTDYSQEDQTHSGESWTLWHWPGMVNLTDVSWEMYNFLNQVTPPVLHLLPRNSFEGQGPGVVILGEVFSCGDIFVGSF